MDEDIYALTEREKRERGVGELPGSLREAVEALKADMDFLSPIFTEDVLEKVIQNGEREHMEVAARPHPQEFQFYFDI